jgi:hypothetical protein
MRISRRQSLAALSAFSLGGLVNADEPLLGPGAPAPSGRAHRDVRRRRELLYELLGDLPDRRRPIGVKKRSEAERDGYVLETLELDLNGIEPVPAFLARPKGAAGRIPAVLFNHSHGGGYDVGKKEFVDGRSYLAPVPYARALTERGWMGLSIDHWVFGERARASESDTFKAMLWQGRVLWGMMVYDSLRALDYLVGRDDVDAARLATLGISMGSTMAWWTAALDERVRATVDICCLSEFHTLLRQGGLKHHGIYYYVPSLLKHFTTADINALIAPRAHLGIAGLKDVLTPVEGLDIIDKELQRVYAEANAAENWRLVRYDVGHQETPEARAEILAFLAKHLA